MSDHQYDSRPEAPRRRRAAAPAVASRRRRPLALATASLLTAATFSSLVPLGNAAEAAPPDEVTTRHWDRWCGDGVTARWWCRYVDRDELPPAEGDETEETDEPEEGQEPAPEETESEPAPEETDDTEPAPEEPAPEETDTEPAPEEPAPEEPAPEEPAPEEPAPAPEPGTADDAMWLSAEELAALPTSGEAWEALTADAEGSWGSADVADQDSDHDTYTYAGALVAARTGDQAMLEKVRSALADAPGTESGGRTLALGRNLLGYVLAADLIDYREPGFVAWVDQVRTRELDGRTLVSTHEDRPNNWGTHAGASRIAAALYLGDDADLQRAADVFAGWLGDRSRYAAFKYGDLDWQCNPDQPVGINPAGCTIDGHNVDGVLADDLRRAGGFTWPPPTENYVYEALQGAVVQAELLSRAGHDAWQWSDQALVRAMTWLYEVADFPAEGDDTWIPHLVNSATGSSFGAPVPSQPGKHIGYTGWTHQ